MSAIAPGKKINDLSRNLLIIVCEYLTFFEIIALTQSNRRVLKRLDDFFLYNGKGLDAVNSDKTDGGSSTESVSYVKRRGTLFF